MSTLTLDGIGRTRRYSARRTGTGRTALGSPAFSEPQSARPIAVRAYSASGRQSRTLLAGLALGILALHMTLFAVLKQPRTDPPAAPRPRPVEIQLIRPTPPPPPPPVPKVVPPEPSPVAKRTPLPRPAARPQAAPPAPSLPVAPANSVPDAPGAVAVAPASPEPVAAPVQEAAPAPAPPPAEPVTEPRGSAGYLNNPAPVYPEIAQERGWEGRVQLKVHVLATGKPDSVAVATSSGRKVLDDAAIKAVSKWTFMPAKRGASPIAGWVQVPIDFKL